MILIKEFFRKKTIKIYSIIICILLVSIILLLNFAGYYDKLFNELYQENSALIMISREDHYNELIKYDFITSFEKALIFTPDYEYKNLGRAGYEIQMDGNIVGTEEGTISTSKANWEDFVLYGLGKDNIIVYKDNNLETNLNNNEIALSFTPAIEHKEATLPELINQEIGFYFNNNKVKFTISTFYESVLPGVVVAEEVFKELEKDSNLYVYKMSTNDYKKASDLEIKLKEFENNSDYNITLIRAYDAEVGENIEKLESTAQILQFTSYLAIIMFTIIFILLINNIIKDENKYIMVKRMIGFNKIKIFIIITTQLIILCTLALLTSIVISIMLNLFINNLFNFNLDIINVNYVLKIYLFIIMTTVVLCLFDKTTNKNLIRYRD